MKPIKNFFSFLHKNSVSGFITMLLVMTTGCAVNMQDYNAALVQSVLDRNCLLYTSPSPRDRQKSRMPSSA